ncbi:MAG: hypothetical protein ACXABY_02190 [Candidatus Thorarchaeota archaeon]
MSKRIRTRNPDFIKGINFPLQTYAWSGSQFGSSLDAVNGKRATDSSPMIITSQPPGASAKNDVSWQLTFGASHDCVFTLFNGKFFNETSLFEIPKSLAGIYRDSIGTGDDNIYEKVGDVQQIQYVVSKTTAKEGRDAETYGDDVDEARGIGMRIPLMAGGWGRTIGMRPTDPQPSEDTTKRRNDEEHKLARETWKYGPIDLRWDGRRGVWGAWNDLIADHEGQNLGTLVFSTNSDTACGFPYLKGRLEDAWRVLKTLKFASVVGDGSDTQQSAEITTHTEHSWSHFTNGIHYYAPLNSTFIIHRGDDKTTCGSEVSISAPQIEILTGTYFHKDNEFDGPICFSSDDIEIEDLVGCMKFDGAQWIPTVPFDPCERVGFELNVLWENDKVLAEKIIEVCKLALKCCGIDDSPVDPGKARQAAEASRRASESATGAENALDGLPAGSGPGGSYVAGDTLETGGEALTAGEASALNDSLPAASEAYQNSAAKQAEAATAADAAADTQEAAQAASNDLADATSTADATQKAADAANAELAETPGDPAKQQAAQEANEANAEAQGNKAQEVKDFNEANEAAETAKGDAKAADEAANEAAREAKDKGDQVKEDAGDKLPEEVRDAMDQADQDAEAASAARGNAGLSDDEVDDETVDDKIDTTKQDLCDKIDGMACKNQADMVAMGEAVGQMVQKALTDMSTAVNTAMGGLADSINDKLGSSIPGYDPETGTGGVEFPLVESPPACPIATNGSGKSPPPGVGGVVSDPGDPADGEGPITAPPFDPTNTGTGGDGGGGPPGTEPRGGPNGQPPTGDDPKDVPPPTPPPMCPIITIKDPCGTTATFGPCPGGKGSGTPGGTAPPGQGDPGTADGAPTGGATNDGQVFKPTGKTVGLGGQNTGLGLGSIPRG